MDVWRAFEPENKEQPLWTMKKAAFCSFGPQLHIFLPSNTEREVPDYTINGQWLCKTCTINFGEQKVAEVIKSQAVHHFHQHSVTLRKFSYILYTSLITISSDR